MYERKRRTQQEHCGWICITHMKPAIFDWNVMLIARFQQFVKRNISVSLVSFFFFYLHWVFSQVCSFLFVVFWLSTVFTSLNSTMCTAIETRDDIKHVWFCRNAETIKESLRSGGLVLGAPYIKRLWSRERATAPSRPLMTLIFDFVCDFETAWKVINCVVSMN